METFQIIEMKRCASVRHRETSRFLRDLVQDILKSSPSIQPWDTRLVSNTGILGKYPTLGKRFVSYPGILD